MFEASSETATGPAPPRYLEYQGKVFDRFGSAASAGYQPVPHVLLFHQAELGLRSEDLNVLLHITAHWYVADQMPYPQVARIAQRMGVSERTVQRSLSRMRKLGLIGRGKNDEGRQVFDLTPLIERLEPLGRKRLALREMARGPFGMA